MINSVGFLFISNSTKFPPERLALTNPVVIDSFGLYAFRAADKQGMKLYCGLNKTYPEQVKCTNFDIVFYDQHIYRDIFAWKDNKEGYKRLCSFLKEHPDVEIIHCNTPIGGLIGRLCGWKYRKKVIYTAHGFHFFKGAPLKNWLLYYPIEKLLARMTDVLITINKEDYELAKTKFKLRKGGKVVLLPGVGMETSSFSLLKNEHRTIQEELTIDSNSKIGIVVGDLNDNKNVSTIIRAMPLVKSSFHVIICGIGPLEKSLRDLSDKTGVSSRVHFLGFRKDIKELLLLSDIFLFASKREGLPRSTMEAMCAGLPCVVSDIRGNRDLIDTNGGFLIKPNDYEGFADAVNNIFSNPEKSKQMGNYNKNKVKAFDIDSVVNIMFKVLQDLSNNIHGRD